MPCIFFSKIACCSIARCMLTCLRRNYLRKIFNKIYKREDGAGKIRRSIDSINYWETSSS